ncbi:MAG TPA: beta-ketoacyl-[acyl-carrier-protein] synthase family protein [Phycisphaerae bacterium]|nr:beta-ketoacyl-[acyl-carrier-protein] synthase family protein [Phycisphaerae bacterium]
MPPHHAVAITGMGAVTAQGIGVPATWQGVAAARDVLAPWSEIEPGHPLRSVKVAACPADLPRPADLPPRLWNALSRTQQLACIAADEALAQARLPDRLREGDGEEIGLFVATTVCGMDKNERFAAQYRENPDSADVNLMRRLQPYEVGELLARRHRIARSAALREVCLTTCVGSAMAIGAAADAIALGECEIALAGGSEALCRVVLSGFHSLKVTAPDGCRPFDAHRPGMTVGEGAGILVLEHPEHARARKAPILAYLRGFGVTCDAYHITAPDPAGVQAIRAMRDALARAHLQPGDIGYINAHGTGTKDNDAMEAGALHAVFAESPEPPMVSSTKRCTGHTFGAAGVIEAILCLQALHENLIPPNAGSVEGDADPAMRLPVPRNHIYAGGERSLRAVMSTNFAFGGNNTALVFAREED